MKKKVPGKFLILAGISDTHEEANKKAAKRGRFLFRMPRYSVRVQLMRKELEYAGNYGNGNAVVFMGVNTCRLPAKLRHQSSGASFAGLDGIGRDDALRIASLIGQMLF